MNKYRHLFLLFSLLCFGVACQPPVGDEPESELTEDPNPVEAGKKYAVDPKLSTIQWTASKVYGQHTGDIKIKQGNIWIEGKKITGGRVLLDMNSITVSDLEGKDKEDLETHLKDSDFFETEEWPVGKLIITSVMEKKDSSFTHEVKAQLTLKGKTKPIRFPATLTFSETGVKIESLFEIDRTRWGITYRGSLDNIIQKMVALKIEVLATPK